MKSALAEQDKAEQSSEIETLREEMSDISADMKSCREKEAELLEFAKKLTETNVSLQVRLFVFSQGAYCRIESVSFHRCN